MPSKLVGAGIKLVVDASHALAELKGALDERFQRQRDDVAAFFMDVAPAPKRAPPAEGEARPAAKPETPPGK